MKSIGAMIKQIAGLHGTSDVTRWENGFIAAIVEFTDRGQDTTRLTEKQLAVIDRLYEQHFAG